jgi:chemotaxis signal transduction protein
MGIPDTSIPDNPDFTVKGFTELRDNICNMINYSDWLKLNSAYEKL